MVEERLGEEDNESGRVVGGSDESSEGDRGDVADVGKSEGRVSGRSC